MSGRPTVPPPPLPPLQAHQHRRASSYSNLPRCLSSYEFLFLQPTQLTHCANLPRDCDLMREKNYILFLLFLSIDFFAIRMLQRGSARVTWRCKVIWLIEDYLRTDAATWSVGSLNWIAGESRRELIDASGQLHIIIPTNKTWERWGWHHQNN